MSGHRNTNTFPTKLRTKPNCRTRKGAAVWSITLSSVILLVASACGQSSKGSGASPTTKGPVAKLLVYQGTSGFPFLPVAIAKAQGMFAKHNLMVEVQTKDGDEAMSLLAAGQGDIAVSLPDFVIEARAAGMPVQIFGAPVKDDILSLYAAPDVQTVADLAGKTLGMHHPGISPDTQLRLTLDKKGVGAGKSTIVDSGGEPPVRLAALEEKKIMATLLLPPFGALAEQQGFRHLLDMNTLLPGFPTVTYTASIKTLTAKADVLRRFVAATVEAIQFIVQNPTAAVAFQAQLLKVPAASIQSDYAFSKAAYSLDGSFTLEGLQRGIDLMKNYGNLKSKIGAADVYDRSKLS